MWVRVLGVCSLLSLAAGLVMAEPTSRAPRPPEKATLDRLNLRMDWTVHLPMQANRDAITLVQSLDDQLFVQTRTGNLFAMDATTGRLQWSATLGDGRASNTVAVAVNSRFVYAIHVTTLYSFHRYSGAVEFRMDLDTLPTAGLSANEELIFTVMSSRPGTAGASRLEVFRLPRPIALPVSVAGKDVARGSPVPNPVDVLIQRYPAMGVPRNLDEPEVFAGPRPSTRPLPAGSVSGSRTPSLAVTQSVNPPYTLEGGGGRTPEILTLHSLQQPYRNQSKDGRKIQHSPSVTVIPPSLAASLALTDLRPKEIRPKKELDVATTSRLLFPPMLTPLRAWIVTDRNELMASSSKAPKREVLEVVEDRVSALPGQANDVGYFPLANGAMLAIDLNRGNLVSASQVWRSTVGGLMDHAPLVTRDSVYASGENSGVARVDRATGNVLWKTEDSADQLLASNEDFIYVRNNQGRLLIFDRKPQLDPSVGRIKPLASADLSAFNVPFMNTMTDRLFLVADNGLIVCLRDANPRYSRPMRMAPEPVKARDPKPGDPAAPMPADPTAPTPPAPNAN